MEIALIFCSTLKDRAYTRICRRFRLLSVRGVMKLSAVQISLDVRQDALALTLGQPRFALEIAGASINAQAQERAGQADEEASEHCHGLVRSAGAFFDACAICRSHRRLDRTERVGERSHGAGTRSWPGVSAMPLLFAYRPGHDLRVKAA